MENEKNSVKEALEVMRAAIWKQLEGHPEEVKQAIYSIFVEQAMILQGVRLDFALPPGVSFTDAQKKYVYQEVSGALLNAVRQVLTDIMRERIQDVYWQAFHEVNGTAGGLQ